MIFDNRPRHSLIFLSTTRFGGPHDNVISPITLIVFRAFDWSTPPQQSLLLLGPPRALPRLVGQGKVFEAR